METKSYKGLKKLSSLRGRDKALTSRIPKDSDGAFRLNGRLDGQEESDILKAAKEPN